MDINLAHTSDGSRFTSNDEVTDLLRANAIEGARICAGVPANEFRVVIPNVINASSRDRGQTWEIDNQAQRDAAAAAQAKAVADAQKSLQDSFIQQWGVQAWPAPSALSANPFQFKDQVVGMQLTDVQMDTETEALMRAPDGTVVLIEDASMPLAKLAGMGVQFIVAFKPQGRKASEALGNLPPVVYGEFVGAYGCRSPGCKDFN